MQKCKPQHPVHQFLDTLVFTPLRGKVRPHRHETVAQQKRRIASRFLRLTLPKTPLRTVFYSVFMPCEAETTANSDAFELAVAQMSKKTTAICDAFNNMVAKTLLFASFLHFCAKNLSLGNVQKHCKNQCFYPTKTRKPSPKQLRNYKIWPPGLPTRHMEKYAFQNQKSKTNSKKNITFLLPFPAGASTN